MRTSAVAVAIVVFSTVIYSVNAEDDFSALLADLTFTDAPAAVEPLAKAPSEPEEELKPVREFAMPATAPAIVDLSEILQSSELESRDIEMPAILEAELRDSVPQIALQDPVPSARPVPSAQPVIASSSSPTSQRFDLSEAFALQTPAPAVPGRVVGHQRLHTPPSACGGGCDQPAASGPGMVYRPRSSVNLPTSTLLQYFGSNPCYTNVWDGYQRKCVHHSHLHGTCDCFQNKCHGECGEVIECAPANCVKREGNCD